MGIPGRSEVSSLLPAAEGYLRRPGVGKGLREGSEGLVREEEPLALRRTRPLETALCLC